jgi:hypothetical protein
MMGILEYLKEKNKKYDLKEVKVVKGVDCEGKVGIYALKIDNENQKVYDAITNNMLGYCDLISDGVLDDTKITTKLENLGYIDVCVLSEDIIKKYVFGKSLVGLGMNLADSVVDVETQIENTSLNVLTATDEDVDRKTISHPVPDYMLKGMSRGYIATMVEDFEEYYTNQHQNSMNESELV